MEESLQSLDLKNSNQYCTIEKDFYVENGLYVFTEAYHLKRGKCCKSGCRHCPYKFRKQENEFQ